MPSPVAYLIYATATLSGFPSQQWTAIEYPSAPICEAKAREFTAFERKPERVKERGLRQIEIKIWPRCVNEPPPFWVTETN
jgi:hypothetical protein